MTTTDGAPTLSGDDVTDPAPAEQVPADQAQAAAGDATAGHRSRSATGSLLGLLESPRAARDGSDLFAAAEDARTVTSAAAALLAVTAPAPARTWTVEDVTEPPPLPTSLTGRPRGSRIAVVATGVVVVGVLAGLGWLVWAAWQYVTTAPDAAQAAHWEQLRGLIDVAVAAALLVVGTVLGAGLQARWTAVAREEAATHARAAAAQHAAAQANADAARHNASAAVTAGSDLARALELLDQVRPLLTELQGLVAARDRAGTQFVTVSTIGSATRETHLGGYRLDRAGDVRLAETDDETVDRGITTLAVRAGLLADAADDWLLRRR